MRMTVSLLIISFSWTMIFSISVWTSSSFNSVPLLQIAQRRQHAEQIAQRRQHAEQIAALTEEIEELRSRQAMILHSLDCKNDGEAQRFGSYLDKPEEMQERLATQRESLAQQLSVNTKQYLEIENTIQPGDGDAVRKQRTVLRQIIAAKQVQTLYRERHVDDTAISLAEKIVDTEIENVYSTPKQQNISQSHNEKFR